MLRSGPDNSADEPDARRQRVHSPVEHEHEHAAAAAAGADMNVEQPINLVYVSTNLVPTVTMQHDPSGDPDVQRWCQEVILRRLFQEYTFSDEDEKASIDRLITMLCQYSSGGTGIDSAQMDEIVKCTSIIADICDEVYTKDRRAAAELAEFQHVLHRMIRRYDQLAHTSKTVLPPDFHRLTLADRVEEIYQHCELSTQQVQYSTVRYVAMLAAKWSASVSSSTATHQVGDEELKFCPVSAQQLEQCVRSLPSETEDQKEFARVAQFTSAQCRLIAAQFKTRAASVNKADIVAVYQKLAPIGLLDAYRIRGQIDTIESLYATRLQPAPPVAIHGILMSRCYVCTSSSPHQLVVSFNKWIEYSVCALLLLEFQLRSLQLPGCTHGRANCAHERRFWDAVGTALSMLFRGLNRYRLGDQIAQQLTQSIQNSGGFSLEWFIDYVFGPRTPDELDALRYAITDADFHAQMTNQFTKRLLITQNQLIQVCSGCAYDYSPAAYVAICRSRSTAVTEIPRGPCSFIHQRVPTLESFRARQFVTKLNQAARSLTQTQFGLMMNQLHRYTGLVTMVNNPFAVLHVSQFVFEQGTPSAQAKRLILEAIESDIPGPLPSVDQATARQRWNQWINPQNSALQILFLLCEFSTAQHNHVFELYDTGFASASASS